MPFNSSNLSRDELLARYFPHYRLLAPQPHTGLSGASCIIEEGTHRLVLRQHHDPRAPAFLFRRQYHALRRLPASLVPTPRFFGGGWMAVDYLAGETKSVLPDAQTLATMLYHLHRQPRLGWRVALLPLLEQYWQQAAPGRRTPLWLAQLKRLRHRGEPRPLRLAPLHMDVHAGNVVHTPEGVRLIDWEYAGDGDVALELAAVWMETEATRRALVEAYARTAALAAPALLLQVARWRPWVRMLMAGWYELRLAQSGDQQFKALADEIWRQF